MKYINVDKLIAEIDKKWKELADKNVKVGGGKWDAEISTYLSVLRLIDSLQQEQEQHIINGQVLGATDFQKLYNGEVYIISNLIQSAEFEIKLGQKVKMLLIKN